MVGFSGPQKNSLDLISRVKVHLHYLHINEFPKRKVVLLSMTSWSVILSLIKRNKKNRLVLLNRRRPHRRISYSF